MDVEIEIEIARQRPDLCKLDTNFRKISSLDTPGTEFEILEEAIHNTLESATYRQREDNMVYGRERGPHLLAELATTKARIEAVEAAARLLDDELGNLNDQISDLTKMVNELCAQSEGYRNCRNLLLEVYKRDKEGKNPDYCPISMGSNVAAHRGDAVTDSLLYEQGMRTDAYIIKKIYGLAYGDIISRSRRGDTRTISILNKRATMYVKDGVPAKVDEAFRDYVDQLDNPQDLQEKDLSDKMNQLLKCDRNRPCENCKKRSQLCVYSQSASRGAADVQPRQSTTTPRHLHDRIKHLEEIVHSLVGEGKLPAAGQTSSPPTASPAESSDSAQKIADSFGRLKIDESGTSYVGSSHWEAILEDLEDMKGLSEPSEKSYREASPSLLQPPEKGVELLFGVDKAITREEILNTLPPKPLTDHMVSQFFQVMEMGSLILHPPTFRKDYELFWEDPSNKSIIWIGMLFSVLCLTSCCNHLGGVDTRPTKLAQHDIELYRKRATQCLVLGNYTKPGPYTLQALLLYTSSEYMRCQDADFGLSLLIGMVVRLAMRMGYHRDPSHYPHISAFDGEMRRRIWLLITHVDLQVSFQFGLPRLWNEMQTDTKPPHNLLNEDFDENTTELPPERPETEPTPIAYPKVKMRLMYYYARIVDLMESSSEHSYDEILKCDSGLNGVLESIPARFKLTKGFLTEDSRSIMQKLAVELAYNKGRCILHKRYFTLSNDSYNYSRKTCLDAALRILQIQAFLYRESQPGGPFYRDRWKISISSIVLHDFLVAAMIVCVDLDRELNNGTYFSNPPSEENNRCGFGEDKDKLQVLESSYNRWWSFIPHSRDVTKALEAIKIIIDRCHAANQGLNVVESGYAPEAPSMTGNPPTQAGMVANPSTNDPNSFPAPHFPSASFAPQTQLTEPQLLSEFSSDSAFKIIETMMDAPPNFEWDLWDGQTFQRNAIMGNLGDMWNFDAMEPFNPDGMSI
ncbi:hypothetical protein FQN51_008418 [Onygenales sp. PD_10]|nr:hypothetical protein FQN51_008418 [Onygenales sp. PD_10]